MQNAFIGRQIIFLTINRSEKTAETYKDVGNRNSVFIHWAVPKGTRGIAYQSAQGKRRWLFHEDINENRSNWHCAAKSKNKDVRSARQRKLRLAGIGYYSYGTRYINISGFDPLVYDDLRKSEKRNVTESEKVKWGPNNWQKRTKEVLILPRWIKGEYDTSIIPGQRSAVGRSQMRITEGSGNLRMLTLWYGKDDTRTDGVFGRNYSARKFPMILSRESFHLVTGRARWGSPFCHCITDSPEAKQTFVLDVYHPIGETDSALVTRGPVCWARRDASVKEWMNRLYWLEHGLSIRFFIGADVTWDWFLCITLSVLLSFHGSLSRLPEVMQLQKNYRDV